MKNTKNGNKKIMVIFIAAWATISPLSLLCKYLSITFADTIFRFFFKMLHLFLVAPLESIAHSPLIQAEMVTECVGGMSKDGSSQSPPQRLEHPRNTTFDEQVVPPSPNVRMIQANFDLDEEQKRANDIYLSKGMETSDRMLNNGIDGVSTAVAASVVAQRLPTGPELLGGGALTAVIGGVSHGTKAFIKKF